MAYSPGGTSSRVGWPAGQYTVTLPHTSGAGDVEPSSQKKPAVHAPEHASDCAPTSLPYLPAGHFSITPSTQ
jgi:hypothetical protein